MFKPQTFIYCRPSLILSGVHLVTMGFWNSSRTTMTEKWTNTQITWGLSRKDSTQGLHQEFQNACPKRLFQKLCPSRIIYLSKNLLIYFHLPIPFIFYSLFGLKGQSILKPCPRRRFVRKMLSKYFIKIKLKNLHIIFCLSIKELFRKLQV